MKLLSGKGKTVKKQTNNDTEKRKIMMSKNDVKIKWFSFKGTKA